MRLITRAYGNLDVFPQVILEQGGLAPGGLNFDCKVRRESTALEDMFISHIGEWLLLLCPSVIKSLIKERVSNKALPLDQI